MAHCLIYLLISLAYVALVVHVCFDNVRWLRVVPYIAIAVLYILLAAMSFA